MLMSIFLDAWRCESAKFLAQFCLGGLGTKWCMGDWYICTCTCINFDAM